MSEPLYCQKCRKTMADSNFYTYKNGTKAELCKGCLTMHINNFESDTFLWLLEKFDVPYIEAEWNVLRDRAFAKDPYKMNGMSVFGKYLSKMKLKQWKNFNWADTEKLKLEAEEKAKLHGNINAIDEEQLQSIKESFENGEITEAQYKTYMQINQPEPSFEIAAGPNRGIYPTNDNPFEIVEITDVGADLTQEDKVFLALKWGRLYSAADWVALEQLYNEFMNSFDIQGAARIDTLKKICKTSLKMDQSIDSGDIDSYQKLSRVYDMMMKSAKFTEAQNKEGNGDSFNSIGELVAFCEKEGGFIPRHQIDYPADIIDKVIMDLKEYTSNLIKQDVGLSQQIEQYIKRKEIAEEQKRNKQDAKDKGMDYVELNDEDYAKYYDDLELQREEDAKLYEEEN